MKVLTNIQTIQIGGISQAASSFLQFLENHNQDNVHLVGVDVKRHYTPLSDYRFDRKQDKNFTLITAEFYCQRVYELALKASSLRDLERSYQKVIQAFARVINEEKPDLIIINGTYIIPWCLYLAARATNLPIILHYHGVITKESESWEPHAHLMMKKMEQTFDNSRLFYIFPSGLARAVVEREVFGHPISRSAVLPNPIPAHFFEVAIKNNRQGVGIVGRWTEIKNPAFVEKLALFNKREGSDLAINMVTDLSDQDKEKKLARLVKVYPPMDSQDLAQFYSRMAVMICPSLFETYGNVPQEAVAAGTPALVGFNMGVAETYRKFGLEDWIVDFSSVERISDKIREVSQQKVLPKTRRDMKEALSPNKIHRAFFSILAQV